MAKYAGSWYFAVREVFRHAIAFEHFDGPFEIRNTHVRRANPRPDPATVLGQRNLGGSDLRLIE